MRWLIRTLILAVVMAAAASCRATDKPALILISIDGFRWDYLDRFKLPVLQGLAARGVRSAELIPVFPSKTYPNHHTIATGLYPARHGIVANRMVDPGIPGRFDLADREIIADPRWWGGEPIWNTAARQGLKSATVFWPGSDHPIGGRAPTYWIRYDEKMPDRARVEQLLTWLRLPPGERASFYTLYFGNVDAAGHEYGPDSPEVAKAAADADAEIGYLLDGIKAAGVGDVVDIIVLSDHGMSALSRDRQIVLDDYIDLQSVDVIDWSPVLGIAPKEGDPEAVYRALVGRHPALAVYRNGEIPEEFRLAGHPRVAPVVGIATDGWQIVSRQDQARWLSGKGRPPRGNHGYDPRRRSMHGLFIAAGPRLKSGVRVPALENIQIYALMCAILGIEPAPNDGDLRVTSGYLR